LQAKLGHIAEIVKRGQSIHQGICRPDESSYTQQRALSEVVIVQSGQRLAGDPGPYAAKAVTILYLADFLKQHIQDWLSSNSRMIGLGSGRSRSEAPIRPKGCWSNLVGAMQ
jgi:hypothetical protein